MISQTAEYALRAIVWLGAHPESPLTTEQIAGATRVPTGYLSKVLQKLGRAGFVQSQPGPGGGFQLVRETEKLTVLEVINAVDPIERITKCPLGLETHRARLCPLHLRLDAARALVEDAFRSCTISELFDSTEGLPPLCTDRGAREEAE